MSKTMLPYLLVFLISVFLASVSQVLLKKAALRSHKNMVEEYMDWRVILGYAIFFGCTLLTMFAYRGIPISLGPVLETTGYLYVTIFSITIFGEKVDRKKWIALAVIVAGILIYAL